MQRTLVITVRHCHFRITTHFERERILGLQSVLQILIVTQYLFFVLHLFINLPILLASPCCVHFGCFTAIHKDSLTSLLSDNRCSLSEFLQKFLPFMILKMELSFTVWLVFWKIIFKSCEMFLHLTLTDHSQTQI